jgi:hypothetical protein
LARDAPDRTFVRFRLRAAGSDMKKGSAMLFRNEQGRRRGRNAAAGTRHRINQSEMMISSGARQGNKARKARKENNY